MFLLSTRIGTSTSYTLCKQYCELELWATKTIFFFSWLLIEQSKAVSCVIIIPRWFEGSVSVLCDQSELPVGILVQLALCHLVSNVPMRRGP